MTRDEVLQAVTARVPYLRASTTIDDRNWVRSDALIFDAATLAHAVHAAMAGFETDDEMVAASLFGEAYAFRVAGVALAAYALDLPVPAVAPGATAVTVDRPRPAAVAYLDPDVRPRTAPELAHDVIDGHLAPFVAALQLEFTVGERLLWGNVAAACAVAFRAVESTSAAGAESDRARVRARAQAFVDACGSRFDGLGRYAVVEHAGHEGWYWDRTSCCLWFRTANGRLCDNCSMIEAADLRRHRTDELSGRPAE